MAEPQRFALHHGLDLDQSRRAADLVEHRGFAALLQRAFQYEVFDEMRDDAVLALGSDDHQALGTGFGRLGGHQLYARGIDHRQQFLGHRFGCRQEAGTETGGGHNSRAWHHHVWA